MKLILLSLLVLVIAIPLLTVNSFATSNQTINKYNQADINFQHFKIANKMNLEAKKNHQINTENQQKIHRVLDSKYSVSINDTQNLLKQKYILAQKTTKSDVDKRSWYDTMIKDQKKKMLEFFNEYKQTNKYRNFAHHY